MHLSVQLAEAMLAFFYIFMSDLPSYEIPLQRVLIKLLFFLVLLHPLVFLVDLELRDVQSVFFHLRNVSLVRFLGLCSISLCVRTSRQVSERFERVMSLTQVE